MDTPMLYVTVALTALAAIAMIAVIGLKGFTAWIDLKRAELQSTSGAIAPNATSRIEIADLKERLRKLEAIAAGVDL
jgi:hypothetical protein